MLAACLSDEEDDDDPPDILNRDWTGLCYTAVLEWAQDAEEDWLIIHGTIWSDTVGKRIEHAWCERGEFVVDLAMPVGARMRRRGRQG